MPDAKDMTDHRTDYAWSWKDYETAEAGNVPISPPKAPRLRMGEFILDYLGDPWIVAETRQTSHDFVLFLGKPKEMTGPMGRQTIITAELAAHFERFRRNPSSMDIPLGKTAIGRIRSVLGHHRYQDYEAWWLDRLTDLHELTTADFCVRHRVSAGSVSQARQAYLGEHRLRNANWWRTDDMQALLHSKMPTAWIAQQTGLAAVTVRKYRLASMP